jgi:signal transduction histidine kinase
VLSPSKPQTSEYTNLNRVIEWFIILRWVACLGVFITLTLSYILFDLKLRYQTLFVLNGAILLVNLGFTVYYEIIKRRNLTQKELSIFFLAQVCCDYALLLLLCYFTGFLENPFIFYFVFHIMMTSFIFPSGVVSIYIGILNLVLIALTMAEYYQIIPHFSLNLMSVNAYFDFIFMRAAGLCTTLILSAYLITSMKKRLEERGKKVEIELDHYKSLDKIKSNFILQVTHELRGPLAALMGYHEMVIKGIMKDTNPRTKETIQKANLRAKNLLTMIDEMIDYAYMKSDEEVRYGSNEIRMEEVINYNLELFYNQARSKSITFTSNCSKYLTLRSNRDLLNIILNNLISNAVKYSHRDTTISVNAEEDGETVHIMVKDEGMGIQPDELDKIFEEFYRTRRAREIDKDGTGLGLPIIQKAVESLNGKITVYSEEEKGTTFHIYLPHPVKEIIHYGGNNGKQQNSHH